MHQRFAQEYIQADVQPPPRESVDWQHKPSQFKLYTESIRLPLPDQQFQKLDGAPFSLAWIGALLADLYGLTQQDTTLSTIAQKPGLFSRPFHRAVPSGGALFPCEIYLFMREGYQVPAGIYHYDVAHHALDLLQHVDAVDAVSSQLAHPSLTPAACVIALSCFFWKDGFKYGAFSYRLQGFDLGTILAQGLMLLQQHACSTTVHYQFLDENVNTLLGLDTLQESVYALITLDQETFRPQHSPPEKGSEKRPDGINRPQGPELPSVASWPLVEAVHRSACMKQREQFRDLRCLASIMPLTSNATYVLPPTEPEINFLEHAQQRRSAHHFLPRPITLRQLSVLCQSCLAGYRNDIDGATPTLQHTLLYCVVNRVEELPAGIYYYDPHKHTCELVTAGDHSQALLTVQKMRLSATCIPSICFFAVGNYATGLQEYGDRWYRMQNMEAGIIVQRLYQAAATLGLGCRTSLGFSIQSVHRLLSLAENIDALIEILLGPEPPHYASYRQPLRYVLSGKK